jgi:Tfp pilus assembly PilM family ATPase
MRRFGTQSRSPIGLDIGPRTIAAAQLVTGRGGLRLDAAAKLDRPAGAEVVLTAEEAGRVAQVLRRQGFVGRQFVLAIPEQRLLSAMLELPPRSSGAPLEQLARMEMSRANRLEPGGFEMACWEVPGPARAAAGTHMMAVACRHADADELIGGMEPAGLHIAALDARAWAIARACQPALEASETTAAVLDMTENAALLAIVHDGAPAYERLLSDGALERLRDAIRAKLGMDSEVADHLFERMGLRSASEADDDVSRGAAALLSEHLEALATELRTALAYAEHRFSAEIRRVLVQGSGAAIPGVPERLSELLGIPAQALSPADIISVQPAVPTAACTPALMAAVGLAMHGQGRRAAA